MFLYALISPGTSATKEKPINRELKPRANNKNVAKKEGFSSTTYEIEIKRKEDNYDESYYTNIQNLKEMKSALSAVIEQNRVEELKRIVEDLKIQSDAINKILYLKRG